MKEKLQNYFDAAKIFYSIMILALVNFINPLNAATGNWASATTGGNITYTTTESSSPLKDVSGNYLTIVYLENLSLKKIGQNTNAEDVAWLLAQGYRVVELDYASHAKAISPDLNADIISINDALYAGSFCGLTNCSKLRSWVLFEGYRLARDVSYFKDDPTTYNYPTAYISTTGDSLYMDIAYPANATEPVPVVLSFSYSNSWYTNSHQRMNLGNTLASFNDSFLEGAPGRGMAWAIADHPKYCDWGQGKPTGGANKAYGAYETNPDAAQKVKSAVRTLRVKGENLNLSGKIGIYGFSRGSTAGSMAVGDKSVTTFENAGLYIGTNDDVQVAALGSGVFDYTLIYNTEESDVGNLRTNCPLGWGDMATNLALWQTQGSSYLAETSASAPVIFFYNTTDALYYQDQIAKFKTKLDGLGVTTATVVDYGTGHAVPQTSAPLTTVYNFFQTYLTPPSVYTGIVGMKINNEFSLTISPNPVQNELKFSFNMNNGGKVNYTIYDVSGTVVYKTEKMFLYGGSQTESLSLNKMSLTNGLYFLKVENAGNNSIQAFAKK